MKISKNNDVLFSREIFWLCTKYQLLTKFILFFILFPIFKFILKYLIESTGRVSVSSGDYIEFLFSVQGFGLLIVSLIVLIILIGMDINSYIIMGALIKENKIKLTMETLFLVGIKSLKLLFEPTGILIMIYVALVVPLVGVGLSISATRQFEIPNFIMDVIFNNNLYFGLYLISLIILTIITFIYTFFFHYLIIENENVVNSLKKSSKLMKNHWKEFIKEFIIKLGCFFILFFLIVMSPYLLSLVLIKIPNILFRRIWIVFTTLFVGEIFAYMSFMEIPIIIYNLTKLFYKFNEKDGNNIEFKGNIGEAKFSNTFNKMKFRDKITLKNFILLLVLFNLTISLISGIFFENLFVKNKGIEIIAHRGGGNLAAENSILGMERALNSGAKWSEIDVQRTKDGYYIINHDSSFLRLSGVEKTSQELTLEEIKKLKIKDLFNKNGTEEPVATLEEFLEASKGKIGLFIELKGSTADTKMVDDVVRMVKNKNMEREVALLSLNYKLISYIEEKYPEMDSGFLYFFSIGDTKNLKGDMLIMEEREATSKKIKEIQKMGKKVIVWTVNTEKSIQKFVLSNVDGIITDYVNEVKKGIEERDNRSELKIILDKILE